MRNVKLPISFTVIRTVKEEKGYWIELELDRESRLRIYVGFDYVPGMTPDVLPGGKVDLLLDLPVRETDL